MRAIILLMILMIFCTNSLAQDPIALTPFDTLCLSGDPYVLDHATPTGGTWSGEGVSNGVFDPFGVGNFAITYTIIDPDGGWSSATQLIEVVDVPEVTVISGDPTSICDLDPLIYQASPASGIWEGDADENGVVDRSCAARPVSGEVAYVLSAVNGGSCTWSTGSMPDLLPCDYIDLGPDQLICDNADTLIINLYYSPSGYGGLSGDIDLVEPSDEWPETTGYFYPDKPAGQYFIYGIVNGPFSCPGYDTLMVTVEASPIVEFEMENSFNLSDPPIAVYGGSPAGGYYLLDDSIPIMVLDPAILGISSHTLHYYYTDPLTECTGEESINIDIGTVAIEDPSSRKTIQLMPNPAYGQVQVHYGSQEALIILRDITGRMIGSWRAGSSPFTLELEGYASGRYTITVQSDRANTTMVLLLE